MDIYKRSATNLLKIFRHVKSNVTLFIFASHRCDELKNQANSKLKGNMSYFHYRCGERISLINENSTAIRNDRDFDHGIVLTAEPLVNDTLFEIKIDRKVQIVDL